MLVKIVEGLGGGSVRRTGQGHKYDMATIVRCNVKDGDGHCEHDHNGHDKLPVF